METLSERQDQKTKSKSLTTRVILLVALGFEILSLIGGGVGGAFSTGGLILGVIGLVNAIVDQTKKKGSGQTRAVNWILLIAWLVSHPLIGKYIF